MKNEMTNEELCTLYSEVIKLCKPAEKHFVNRSKTGIDLYTKKSVKAFGKEYPDMFFAGVKLNKGYIGFYFMPIYCEPTLVGQLDSELLKLLKGKSCFHLKKITPELKLAIKHALELGIKNYREKEWI